MINYYLQTNVQIDGVSYAINKRGDYRVILDVISALNDEELDNQQRAFCALNIFYDWNIPPNPEKAVNEMLLFINCGESDGSKNSKPPIMNWEKDFNMLVAPINKALGCEIRAVEYLVDFYQRLHGNRRMLFFKCREHKAEKAARQKTGKVGAGILQREQNKD